MSVVIFRERTTSAHSFSMTAVPSCAVVAVRRDTSSSPAVPDPIWIWGTIVEDNGIWNHKEAMSSHRHMLTMCPAVFVFTHSAPAGRPMPSERVGSFGDTIGISALASVSCSWASFSVRVTPDSIAACPMFVMVVCAAFSWVRITSASTRGAVVPVTHSDQPDAFPDRSTVRERYCCGCPYGGSSTSADANSIVPNVPACPFFSTSRRAKSIGMASPYRPSPSHSRRIIPSRTVRTRFDGTGGGSTSDPTTTKNGTDRADQFGEYEGIADTATQIRSPGGSGQYSTVVPGVRVRNTHGDPATSRRIHSPYPAISIDVPSVASVTASHWAAIRPTACPSSAMNADVATTRPVGAFGVRLSRSDGGSVGRVPAPPSAWEPPTIPRIRFVRRMSASTSLSLSTTDPVTAPRSSRDSVIWWTRTRSDRRSVGPVTQSPGR